MLMGLEGVGAFRFGCLVVYLRSIIYQNSEPVSLCLGLNLRQTDNTRVDPEFGAKLAAKLMGNLRITRIAFR
jgi:hypothetical protein